MSDEMTPGEIGRTLTAILGKLDRIDAKFEGINTRFDDLTKVYVAREVYERDLRESRDQRDSLATRLKSIEDSFVANRRLVYGALITVIVGVVVTVLQWGAVR